MKPKNNSWKGISTVAMHANGNEHDSDAHLVPIYATSTFTFPTAEEGMERFKNSDKSQIYSRWGNPTFKAAEQTIEQLETFRLKDSAGEQLQVKALLHASGQAAMTTMFMSNLQAGDAILSHYSLYGGTYELMHKVLAQTGVQTIIEDLRNLESLEQALKQYPKIKLVHIETPANPTIQCVDIEAVTKLAHHYGKLVTVDNTFATPYLQQPFAYGVDFVFHSTTKFLNGHGNAIGGVLLGKDIEFMKTKAWKWYALLGGNSNPFDAFLLSQGMKTLEVRMERHCSNGLAIAEYLQQHPAVAHVNYAGFASHPDHATCMKQMKHPGPMLSFELKGGLAAGKKFIDALKMCVRAVSLGTVDTLISHPASMTHFGVSAEEKAKYGITDGLIRMSVGIEYVEDIKDDLDQALQTSQLSK
ncbi:MAG: aminotransferase class I/II-fold pyridoxal phosphate-dependent enzyme [Hydrotalea sp.]|jgi:methionine-gamma-lyase|nr:aminotransferase class I/II-fold pyridoxal phosphate-dependent enzyme [Hydrotalea sp.]